MTEDASGPTGIDTARLKPIVRGLLGEPTAVVDEEWVLPPARRWSRRRAWALPGCLVGVCRRRLRPLGARAQGACGGG